MKKLILMGVVSFAGLSVFGAIDLKESKFTQVVNDVQIISTSDNSKHTAAVDGLFKMPDVLRTGPGSRAELVAGDNTITRVGANTIFSFDAANRTINLQQGSLLFNTPRGKGGGSIHTAAATAAVLGTTIIVTTTTNGGFKVLTLEGTAEVKFLKGLSQKLHAGQLIFVLPGSVPGPIVNFRLDQQVSGSKLVTGFGKTLPSIAKINAQITQQTKQIQSGQAQDTGLLAGNSASSTGLQVINVVAQINGSMNAIAGFGGSGGSTNPPTPPPPPPDNGLPPGFVIPNGLTPVINNNNGKVIGFQNPDLYIFRTDPNTTAPVEYSAGPAAATVGAANDITITSPTLDPARIFLTGVDITGSGQSGVVINGLVSATGLFARNITITTPTVDLSPYAGMNLSSFDFVASETLDIASSLVVSGYNGSLMFTAGGQLLIEPGVVITQSLTRLEFSSAQGVKVNSATLGNDAGPLHVSSDGPVTINNSTLTSSGQAFVEGGTSTTISGSSISASIVTLDSAGPLVITGSSIAGDTSISLNSQSTANIAGTTFTAPSVNLSSSGAMVYNNGSLINASSGAVLSGFAGLTVAANVTGNSEQGSITLQSLGGTVLVNGGATLVADTINANAFSIVTGPSVFQATSRVNFHSSSDTVIGGTVKASPSFGSISLTSDNGAVTINGGAIIGADSITAHGFSLSTGAANLNGGSSVSLGASANVTIGGMVTANSTGGGTVNLTSDFGQVTLNSAAQVSADNVGITASSIDTGGATLTGASSVSLQAGNNILATGMITADPTIGTIQLDSDSGQVTVNNSAQLRAANVSMIANSIVTGPSSIQGNKLVNLESFANLTLGGIIVADPMSGAIVLTSDAGPLILNNGATMAAATITLTGNTIGTAANSTITGTSSVFLHAASGMNVSSVIGAGASGSIGLQNDAGQLAVGSAQLNAPTIALQSGNGILVDTVSVASGASMLVLGGMNAFDVTTLQNSDLSNLSALNVSAQTIVMANVALPNSGLSTFITGNGLLAPNPNTDASIIPGDLNFQHGVTYKNQLITGLGQGFTVGHP